jgi:hypothetical protein
MARRSGRRSANQPPAKTNNPSGGNEPPNNHREYISIVIAIQALKEEISTNKKQIDTNNRKSLFCADDECAEDKRRYEAELARSRSNSAPGAPKSR